MARLNLKPTLYRATRGCAPLLAGLTLLLTGCSSNEIDASADMGKLEFVKDEKFKLTDPGRPRAGATGIGCAATPKGAEAEARRTARFNLRGITGNADYNIRFSSPRELSQSEGICVEVNARAVSGS